MGIQDVALTGKFENGLLNPIIEETEEFLDSSMFIRLIGVLIIGCVGAIVKDLKPIGIMIVLIVIFLLSFAFSFLSVRGEGDKLLLEPTEAKLGKENITHRIR